MNLIKEYIELAKICASTDYGDKIAVRLHNESAKRMYEIAERIGYENASETNSDFAKLLDITDNKANVWAAIHILEHIPANKTVEEKALKIIQKHAEGDSIESMGLKIWIDNFTKRAGNVGPTNDSQNSASL